MVAASMKIAAFFNEFKEFALKGNLVELAVAFVMGAAFTRLSTAFIEDLVMPWVGLLGRGSDFTNHYTPLAAGVPSDLTLEQARAEGAVLAWGNSITVGLNFLIVAFVMFLVVKAINRAKRRKEEELVPAAPPELSAQEKLLAEIRDLLKNRP
jgi:large conductance mechanosensitive channel